MPYFESSLDQSDTAELINLKRILELCEIPDVGQSPLDPQLSSSARCTNALTTLEKTISVFDDALYQDAVFMEEMDEDIVESELWNTAKLKGVPEEHFPANIMRTPPACPSAPKFKSVIPIIKEPLIEIQEDQPINVPPLPTPIPTMLKSNLRPGFSLFRKQSTSSLNLSSRPTSPSSSSVFSNFSRSSPARSRPNFINIFRRQSKLSKVGQFAPVSEPSWGNLPQIESDVPSLQSDRTQSQISRSPTISASSRTSTSSFIDHAPSLSWADNKVVQKCSKAPQFVILKLRCNNEAKRFIDFAQHQRVALPLFLGRSRMYLDQRSQRRLEELKNKHAIAIDEMENKHLEQEITVANDHREQQKAGETKNLTALKHMTKRLEDLGANATEEDHQRLEDEKRALAKLVQRQQRDLRNLFRIQNKEKLKRQKDHIAEIEAFQNNLQEDSKQKLQLKEEELRSNQIRLEELIHARCIRLISRWHLMLQIYKLEDANGVSMKGPLPLTILNLPEEFHTYVLAFQS